MRGAEVHCFEICRRLVARGDRVTLFATRFGGALREEVVDAAAGVIARIIDEAASRRVD